MCKSLLRFFCCCCSKQDESESYVQLASSRYLDTLHVDDHFLELALRIDAIANSNQSITMSYGILRGGQGQIGFKELIEAYVKEVQADEHVSPHVKQAVLESTNKIKSLSMNLDKNRDALIAEFYRLRTDVLGFNSAKPATPSFSSARS